MISMAVLDKLVNVLSETFPNIQAVYLFGSAVRHDVHSNSDIDLAVFHKQAVDKLQLWKLAQELAVIAGKDVDLIDLNNASTVMQMQVVSQGKRLMCRDTVACEIFEDFVFSDYARLNEERAGILASIQQQGVIYG